MTDSYRILTSYQNILITGIAGFIGYHLAKRLLTDNPELKVIGIDCINDYYDIRLKEARSQELLNFEAIKRENEAILQARENGLKFKPVMLENGDTLKKTPDKKQVLVVQDACLVDIFKGN